MKPKLAGSIDQIYFEAGQLLLEGWAAIDSDVVQDFFVVEVNNVLCEFDKNVVVRPDLASAFGQNYLNFGFVIRIRRPFSIFTYPKEISVSVPSLADGILKMHSGSIYYQLPNILSNVSSFWQKVQNPGSRVKHDGTLTFLARNSLMAYRNNPPVQAAALCVLVWRDLLSPSTLVNANKITKLALYLLARLNKAADPSSVRWYVSLCNAIAFLAIKAQKLATSRDFFEMIVSKTASMSDTWLCAPNGLSARFMLGYLELSDGHLAAASRHMTNAVSFFESRCRSFEVHNFWSFDELLEAARLSQQALVVRELIDTKANSSRINPEADLDLSRVTTQLIALFLKRSIMPPLKVRPLIKAMLETPGTLTSSAVV